MAAEIVSQAPGGMVQDIGSSEVGKFLESEKFVASLKNEVSMELCDVPLALAPPGELQQSKDISVSFL